MALGRIDDDSMLDAVALDYLHQTPFGGSGRVAIAKGQGDGSFTLFGSFPTSNPQFPRSVATADLDMDGDEDVAIAHDVDTNHLSVRLNDGMGNLSEASLVHSPFVGRGKSVLIGDIEGDADLDVVIIGNQGSFPTPQPGFIRTYCNTTQNGVFNLAQPIDTLIDPLAQAGAIGDMNNDGIDDLVIAHAGSDGVDISVHIAIGDGGFEPTPFRLTLSRGVSPTVVSLGDIDGDGDLDMTITVKNDDVIGDGVVDDNVGGHLLIYRNLEIINADISGSEGMPDGCVDGIDLAMILAQWGDPVCAQSFCASDLNGDGLVNGADLAELLNQWGDGCATDPGEPQFALAPSADQDVDGFGVFAPEEEGAQAVMSDTPWIIAHFGFEDVAAYVNWINMLDSAALYTHISDILELILNEENE